jgi:hypothetical protein
VTAALSPVRAADAPRTLNWSDLRVTLPAGENPFATLTDAQLDALADIREFRARRARGETVLPQEASVEKAAVAKLEKEGVAIDALLAKRDEIVGKLQALERTTNPALDGKVVRLPGYLLPLEMTDRQVTEFLLVPWVGACIHTPPPPPNQIVHVKLDKPYALKGPFEPVWVSGRMAARSASRSVYLSDGAANVDIGYALQASEVQPYR